MHKKRKERNIKYEGRWGFSLFFLSLMFLFFGLWFSNFLPKNLNPENLGRIFFYIGILEGIGVLSIGYFSYPRFHNSKVFLCSHLTGISVLAFSFSGLGLFSFKDSQFFISGLYLLALFGIFISTLTPTFLKYRLAKRITITAVILELFLLSLFLEKSHKILYIFEGKYDIIFWVNFIPGLITLLNLVFSLLMLKHQFFLGGIFGGMGLLLGGGWYLNRLEVNTFLLNSYIFTVAPFFFLIGIFIHWVARLEHRSFYDPLLLVYNRSYCEQILKEQTKIDTSPPFVIAIVDVDRFKDINDKYGHRIGDQVLIHTIRILRNEVGGGVVCRYGGEEFVVLFPQNTLKKVKAIMEAARRAIQKSKIKIGNKEIKVTVSIGISQREEIKQDLYKVLSFADKALYRAKKSGRNQIRFSKTE
ncbi:MAG: GGDEF domain-containing protein [candidate division WOR-3 bacterium]